MEKFYRTETVYLVFEHRLNGTLTNATTAQVRIMNQSEALIVLSGEETIDDLVLEDDPGVYSYSYTSSADAEAEIYTAQAIFTTGSNVNKQGTIQFQLMEELK